VVSGPNPVQDVAVSPDGRVLAVAGASVQLWNLADHRLPPRTLARRTAAALTVAFSPDGHRLAVGYADNAIDLWDLNRPTDPPHPLDGHSSSVLDLTFSPDGHRLASTGSDFTVRLWDVTDPARTAPPAVVLRGHTDTVRAVVFSGDGRRLATGGNDHTLRLWNLDDPAQPTAFGGPLRLGPAYGTASVVTGVAFAPDGHSIAVASSDETVRI
jgi:WD40 repeat protein